MGSAAVKELTNGLRAAGSEGSSNCLMALSTIGVCGSMPCNDVARVCPRAAASAQGGRERPFATTADHTPTACGQGQRSPCAELRRVKELVVVEEKEVEECNKEGKVGAEASKKEEEGDLVKNLLEKQQTFSKEREAEETPREEAVPPERYVYCYLHSAHGECGWASFQLHCLVYTL